MRFFTIHERPARGGGEPEVLAVASGFSWWAAIVPLVWLLWHRLWLGFALYVLFSIAMGVALALGDIADPAATAIGIAVSILIGASAAEYRRWTLARRGWRMMAVRRAHTGEEAEALYIRERGLGVVRPAVASYPAPSQPHAQALPPAPRGTEAFPSLL